VRPFNTGGGRQLEGNIDQLISLAGKRNKQVQLAQWNTASSAAACIELTRKLRLQTLLGSPLPVIPAAGGDMLRQYSSGSYTLQPLTGTALANRPDLAPARNCSTP
jgi:hypothetical protein